MIDVTALWLLMILFAFAVMWLIGDAIRFLVRWVRSRRRR